MTDLKTDASARAPESAGSVELALSAGVQSVPAGVAAGGQMGDPIGDLMGGLDGLPVGVALLGPDLRVRMLNRALEELTGFATGEVRGAPCWAALRTGACGLACPVLNAARRGGDLADPPCCPHSMETDLIDRARRKVPIRLGFTRLTGKNGEHLGWLHSVEDLTRVRELESQALAAEARPEEIVGRCPVMERLLAALPALAALDAPALVTGETGTGKDLFAEALHKASTRAAEPFVKASLAGLPEELVEVELFGRAAERPREGDAAAPSTEARPGRLRAARSGTLYLPELADLPPGVQDKLLTYLEEGIIAPAGGLEPVRAQARIVAATGRDPEELMAEGRLRPDLFRRLGGVRLHLPPLRERGADVEFLLMRFLRRQARALRKPLKAFSAKAMRILLRHDYPGNVRELKNVVEFASALAEGETVKPAHLPAYLLLTPSRLAERPHGGPSTPGAGSAGLGEAGNVEEIERRLIRDALVRAGGRRSEAAQALGWGRSTLWRKMKQYGML